MTTIGEMEVTDELLEAIEEEKRLKYLRDNPPVTYPHKEPTAMELIQQGINMLIEDKQKCEQRKARKRSSSRSSSGDSTISAAAFAMPVVG